MLRNGFTWTQPRSVDFRMTLTARSLGMAGMSQIVVSYKQRPPIARCLKIRILVTAKAIPVGHSLIVKHLSGFVWLVTIDTRGKYVGFLLPELALNDLAMNCLDLRVTLGARPGNVCPCNR
jgi:hypothetical protein